MPIVRQLYDNGRMLETDSFRKDEDVYARAVADAERLRNDSEDRAELAAIAKEMDDIRSW